MTRNEILGQINELFIDTLDNEEIVLHEATQATDIDEWDSLTHILLVVGIEKHFNINFKSDEIHNWKDVGAIIDCICNKLIKT